MKKKFLIDTDIVIDFLRGYEKAVAYLKNQSDEIVLSCIVVAELYAGARDDERERLEMFISLFPVLPITPKAARAGGLFKRDYHKSHGVGLADALIAATVVMENVELNPQHKTLSYA